ncbi:MAG TPA: hypothetical protein ENK44_06460 [Caldithrix abyssi]|uniref:Uncharacterized protein n=1 Tax=Caldithrix abyssi TaxID=187145 RepID=A0A7V4WVF9_CALAY|nr:hypothetical protein [Caldithrix abyssi]
MPRYVFTVLIFVLSIACTNQDKSDILVKIGDREISISEFTSRMELTPRPFYCRGSSEGDKIIALNALIAEKLFAIEEGRQSDLYKDSLFIAYIRGRKEQYMREELFRRMACRPSELDSSEIAAIMRLSCNVYEVEFYKLNDDQAEKIKRDFQKRPQEKSAIFNKIDLTDKVPLHTVEYKDPEYPALHHALYSRAWETGDVIGPVRLRETKHMVLRIKRVLFKPIVSETEYRQRRSQVIERMVEKESNVRWNRFLSRLMHQKSIRFNPQVTFKVAKIYAQQFMNQTDNTLSQPPEQKDFINFLSGKTSIMDSPMFELDGKTWKVKDFRRLVLSHPLVFRKPDMAPEEYLHQFKLAVIDLMKDYYVTREAYAQKIDQSDFIVRQTQMWEDAFLARRHRQRYIDQLKANKKFDPERMKSRYTYIDAYVDSLQSKYSSVIEINYAALKDIRLSNTDFVSLQQFVPYSKIVPEFPPLGIDNKLDFGKSMKIAGLLNPISKKTNNQ